MQSMSSTTGYEQIICFNAVEKISDIINSLAELDEIVNRRKRLEVKPQSTNNSHDIREQN